MKRKGYIVGACIALLIGILIASILIFGNDSKVDINPTEDTSNFLFFGEDSYESSIQSESERLDWTKYDSMPHDLSLTQTLFNDSPYFNISIPNWEESRYDTTILLHDTPVYIAFTIQETKKDLFNKTVDNISQFEILTRIRETETTTMEINGLEVQKRIGACTAETSMVELRKYVAYTFGDGTLQYCFLGVTTYGSDTTPEHLAEAIEEMIQSIGFYGME